MAGIIQPFTRLGRRNQPEEMAGAIGFGQPLVNKHLKGRRDPMIDLISTSA